MNETSRPRAGLEERLIGALVPTTITRPRPAPAPMPALPTLGLPTTTAADDLLLGVARVDHSGRVSARSLLRALGWRPGHRVDVGVVGGALVIGSLATGRHVVGSRGELSLPAAARQMCGILPGPPVVLAASVPQDLLVIHPASRVARLLGEFHARLAGAGAAGAHRGRPRAASRLGVTVTDRRDGLDARPGPPKKADYLPRVATAAGPDAGASPAHRVAKPRRLPSTRRALTPHELDQINTVARTTGNDVVLDAILLRLHTETACRPRRCARPAAHRPRHRPRPRAAHRERRHPALAAGTSAHSPPAATITSGPASATSSSGSPPKPWPPPWPP